MNNNEKKRKPTIYVDGDANPVVEIIEDLANKFCMSVIFVASFPHYSPARTSWVYIDQSQDGVDFYILSKGKMGDLLITHDIGLASIALSKGLRVISPRGIEYTSDRIDEQLFFRHIHAKNRRKNQFTSKTKPFSEEDRLLFLTTLEKILSKFEGNS